MEPEGKHSFRFSKGQEVDIPDKMAFSLIKSGIAEKLTGKKEDPIALPDLPQSEVQIMNEVRTAVIKPRRKRV